MKPNNIFVAATLLTALLMAGCTDSGTTASTGSTGTSSGTTSSVPAVQPSGLARVDFAVAFPDQGQVQASYLDPSMNALHIEVFNSAFGSVDELRSNWTNGGYFSYDDCLYYNYFNPESCQYQPGSLVTSQTISRSNPSTSFELEPGKYQINVTQLNASGAVLAKISSLATFVVGDNNLNLNMLYGSWDFVQPVQLQLLNTAGISHWNLPPGAPINANDAFENLTTYLHNWSRSFYGPNAETPALGLGLANEAGALSLSRIHLSGLPGLRGWGSSNVQDAYGISNLYYGVDYFSGEGFFDGYTRSLNAPHAITLESSQGYIEMGWSSKDLMERESISLGSGVLNPAFLMQQFTGGTNQNWLSLGEISYYREDYLSDSFSPEAGLFFLTPDTAADKELSLFVGQQGQTVTTPLSVTLDSTYEGAPGQQGASLYASEETTWVDADFPATAFPITRMTSASSIEGTLIEYVIYSTEALTPVISDLAQLPAFSSMNPGQEVQLASITPEQHQRIQERIRQRVLANAQPINIQAASVQAASGAPGCFTTHEKFQDVLASYIDNGNQWVANEILYVDPPFEALFRVCLHPFQMQAAALNKPDQQPTLASEMGPIQIEHAGEIAFEALDVSGDFLVNTRLLTLKMLQATNWPVGNAICSAGSTGRTDLGGTSDPSRVKLTFNACQISANLIVQSGEAIIFREVDGEIAKADVQLKNLIIDDGTGSVEHHARYTMSFNGYLESTPYVTHFSGDDYQMRLVGSTDMWHHFKHFDWGINNAVNNPSTSYPARPSFYIASGQWGGKAVRVQSGMDYSWNPLYDPLTPVNPATATALVAGANGTFLDINLDAVGTVNMMGSFSGQSGCMTTASWNDLDGNLPAAAWSCP